MPLWVWVCTHKPIHTHKQTNKNNVGFFFPFNCDFMARATKPDNLSPITRTHMGEGGTCPLKLFFDLHTCPEACMCPETYISTPTLNQCVWWIKRAGIERLLGFPPAERGWGCGPSQSWLTLSACSLVVVNSSSDVCHALRLLWRNLLLPSLPVFPWAYAVSCEAREKDREAGGGAQEGREQSCHSGLRLKPLPAEKQEPQHN